MDQTTFLLRHPSFTTRRFAALCEVGVDSASRTLAALARRTAIVRITRGVWCQPDHARFSVYPVALFLLGNEHGYVSFLSAMHLHGLVSQIPGSIQVATTGHSRELKSSIGRFEFIRIKPQMMTMGIESSDTEAAYGIATAEKALLDTLYIATRKGNRFASLPEVDPAAVDRRKLRGLLDRQVRLPQVRRAIDVRLCALARPSRAAADVARRAPAASKESRPR